MPLAARSVLAWLPRARLAGVPEMIAVPSALWLNRRPAGSAPDSLIDGTGNPVATSSAEPVRPTTKEALAALTIAGAWATVNTNDWVAFGEIPLAAVSARS